MAYIGAQPSFGNFQACDAISTSATDTFNLTVGGVAISPVSAQHCLVSLNGILQAPISSYTIVGSTIVFAAALTSSGLGGVLVVGVVVVWLKLYWLGSFMFNGLLTPVLKSVS